MSWNRTSLGLLLVATLVACSGAPAEEAEDPAMVGWRAERRGEHARAAVAYREATAADPSDADAFLGLARTELRAGRPETAANAAGRAVELVPESADAHELLGRARLARDEAAPAVTALARALELDPERARLHFPLARAHERAQQRDEAVAAYRASADAGVLAARSLVSVARIEIDRLAPGGDLTAVESALDRAEELAGEDAVVRAALVRERRRVERKRREPGRLDALRSAAAMGVLDDLMRVRAGGPFGVVGGDDHHALGALMGDRVGDSTGFGGLGLRGTGRGGGGTGMGTIGLGNTGLVGRGGGIGSNGYGVGRRPSLGARPRLRAEPPTVVGALSADVVRRIHRRHQNEVLYCYERELVADPDLAGTVTVAIAIGPSGAVTSAQVRASTLARSVADCVARATQRWTYPAPESGVVTVTQEYRFDPPEAEPAAAPAPPTR